MISWQYWKAKLERAYSFRVQSGKITVCTGFTAEGSMKYEITGYFAEVFDNLQVSYAL